MSIYRKLKLPQLKPPGGTEPSPRHPPNTPCADQTEESVATWLRANVQLGTEVVVRRTHGGLLSYIRGQVIRLGRGRFEVAERRRDGTHDAAGEAFYYSGKNCWHPKGQTRLVAPTPAVMAACETCAENLGHMPGSLYSYSPSFC